MTRQQRLNGIKLLVFLGVCFAVSTYMFKVAGTTIIPGSEPYRVKAVVPNAVSLAPAADVRTAGVNIGRVKKLASHGEGTVMELQIDDDHKPVYRDARVLVRAKSIAGENYVEIQPGLPKSGEVPSGGVLPISQAGDATQIDELFSVFDDTRRKDLQRTLGGLSDGLKAGGSDLNRTLESTAALPDEGATTLRVFAEQRKHVASLVDSFGAVARALGDRKASVAQLTRQAKTAAEAVAVRDAKLRGLLDALPPFLRQTRSTSTRLASFSRRATPVMRDLRLATEELVPTVNVLRPAAVRGQSAVQELERFARTATPALKALAPFSRRASDLPAPLGAFLQQANPLFAHMAPYHREVATFFANDAGSFQTTDALGHTARILLPISRSDLPGLLTAEQEKNLQALQGVFDTRGTNAYPKPGGAGDATPMTGDYPRLEAEPPYTARRR